MHNERYFEAPKINGDAGPEQAVLPYKRTQPQSNNEMDVETG